uniref:Uncharacterized protein n=1 Tax=Romanomermis culicivorax TaxID=13658 RepID=A0A915K527_ROMCU
MMGITEMCSAVFKTLRLLITVAKTGLCYNMSDPEVDEPLPQSENDPKECRMKNVNMTGWSLSALQRHVSQQGCLSFCLEASSQ